MNSDLSWGSEACRALDVVPGYVLTSWSSWSDFSGPVTPGIDPSCSIFSPFVDNGSHCGFLESQSLRNNFVILLKPKDVNDFVPHLFRIFFLLWHAVLLYEIFLPTSCCQAGYF
ncbi:hypothetical protein AMECASPLE_010026 [Ameca splendens]|uniref:Uncharacterized protein n=1 Tax=Ameca splendens TaxID=208324 RepID=A0ABV0YNQ9_9TELE